MSKILFGNNTVAPVKIPGQEISAGTGINADLLREGTVQVSSEVLTNISSFGHTISAGTLKVKGSVNSSNDPKYSTSLGMMSNVHGANSVAIGYKARAYSERTVVIGSNADSIDNGSHDSVIIGYNASTQYANNVVIGSNAKTHYTGNIAIGANIDSGKAYGNIVIGNSIKAHNNSTQTPSILIGNNLDQNDFDVNSGTVLISPYSYNGQTTNRRYASTNSVAIGNNAGTTSTSAISFVAIGKDASVSDISAVSIGADTIANNRGSVAIGDNAISNSSISGTENGTIALGSKAKTTSAKSIAIGTKALATGLNSNVAIGAGSKAGGLLENNTIMHSIAIGTSATSNANLAIQIGQGLNNVPNSVKFFNTPLLHTDTGLIYPEVLSEFTPSDGQILSYDATNSRLVWINQKGGSGEYTLPVASPNILGGVKVGTGLRITTDGILSTDKPSINWGDIKGTISNQTDLKTELDNKQNVIQFLEMPIPSNKLEGQVAQYIGDDTNPTYSPGNFYKCVEDSYPTANITSDTQFGKLSVDAWTFANFISKYFYNGELEQVPSKLYNIEYVNQYDGYGWIIYENELSIYVKDIYKLGIIAEGADPEEGDKIYVQLYMHGATGWTWKKLLMEGSVAVNNTLTSTSTKQALSANMGRVLSDKVKELSGISHFLAMWDTDTGIARYLETGYQYASGDYFIIAETMTTPLSAEANVPGYTFEYLDKSIWESIYGTSDTTVTFKWTPSGSHVGWYDEENDIVAQEPSTELGIKFNTPRGDELGNEGDEVTISYNQVVNYKPAGTMYPGDTPESKEITTDPVQISDMYFYDGAHWIFLPSSSRQIAVDEELNSNSRNPVENRVVAEALGEKVSTSNTPEVIYATDENGNQQVYSLGAGLDFDHENNEIINTKTSGTWGQISGNITDQNDLVEYVSNNAGGGSALQLMDIFTKENDSITNYSLTRDPYAFKGDYSKLYARIGASYDLIKSAKNDIYITISRMTNSNDARSKRKMRVMNDCNRFKTNRKFYCWRYTGFTEHYGNFDESWYWDSGYTQNDCDFQYIYVRSDYASATDLVNADPNVWMVPIANSLHTDLDADWYRYHDNWGTSFNELENSGNVVTDIDDDVNSFERVPQYDIDEVISLNSDFHGHAKSEYGFGNIVKQEFTKMQCRVYNTAEGKLYLWAIDWTSGENHDIYTYLDENQNPIANEIPDFMGDLQVWMTTDQFYARDPEPTLVEKRPDLNWYYYGNSESQFADTVEHLRLATQDFPDREGSAGGYNTNWNSYWFDYPVRPIRLSQCKIYIYKLPPTGQDSQLRQAYCDRLAHSYTIEEIENDEYLPTMLEFQDDIILELPYDTYHLWMRIFGWQKMAYYHIGDDDKGWYAEPQERHNLLHAIKKSWNQYLGGMNRRFGHNHHQVRINPSNLYFYKFQFNSISGKDLAQNKVSMNVPISRKFYINGVGMQRVVEQM